MPRFYFHTYGDVASLDQKGLDLAGLNEARAEARMLAVEHISERLKLGLEYNPEHRIEIAGADGKIVFTLRFGDLL